MKVSTLSVSCLLGVAASASSQNQQHTLAEETIESSSYAIDGNRSRRLSYFKTPDWSDYMNEWDGELHVIAKIEPRFAAFCGFSSKHDDHYEDRRFRFKYCEMTDARAYSKPKETYPQYEGSDFRTKYQCPADSVVTRIDSWHDNGAEDRAWEIYCNEFSGLKTRSCVWTGVYVNNFDKQFDFECYNGRVITGIDSMHNDDYEDRQFKFQCCTWVPEYLRVQGPDYNVMQGIRLTNNGKSIGYFDKNDYVTYKNINFGFRGQINRITLRYSKNNRYNTLELRIGGPTGTLIAQYKPARTGSWSTFVDVEIAIADVEGIQDLTFVSKGGRDVLDLEWFELPNLGPIVLFTLNRYVYVPAVEFPEKSVSSGHVTFSVQANNDAHIALGVDTQHNGVHYEIVLGGWGNSRSKIRSGNQAHSLAGHYGRVLDGNKHIMFRLSWDANMLKVERANDETSNLVEIMRFDGRAGSDYNYEIKYMMVSTGWGATGDWKVFD